MSKDLTDSNDDEDREPLNPFDGVQKKDEEQQEDPLNPFDYFAKS